MPKDDERDKLFEKIRRTLEFTELLKLSVKVVVVVGVLPTVLWAAVFTPLFLMGHLDMVAGLVVLVVFYVGAFVLLPLTILIIGDLLGGKRELERVDESPVIMGDAEEYLRHLKSDEEEDKCKKD
ncbi:MAG: hypothetical protein QW840_02705, partial [Candidatus Bathyarchaeia archaeon]